VFKTYIKATPQAIRDALTKPEWTLKYGYAPVVEYDLRPGGKYRAFPKRSAVGRVGRPSSVVNLDMKYFV
jgi:hypothetical protein